MCHGVVLPVLAVASLVLPLMAVRMSTAPLPLVPHAVSLAIAPDAALNVEPETRPSAQCVASGAAADGAMDDGASNLFWFVQVSDLHLSVHDPPRGAKLRRFVQTTLPMLNPAFVLVTGDVTDAKQAVAAPSFVGNDAPRGQVDAEWREYRDVLRLRGGGGGRDEQHGVAMPMRTPWLEVRGNHDAFNVASYASESNAFKDNAVAPSLVNAMDTDDGQGAGDGAVGGVAAIKRPGDDSRLLLHAGEGSDRRHYSFTYDTPFGTYAFAAFDACVEPAASRHFFGQFTPTMLDHLERALGIGAPHLPTPASTSPSPTDISSGNSDSTNHNLAVLFGHYPLTSIVEDGTVSSNGRDIQAILRDGRVAAYLSGHLHGFLEKLHPWFGAQLYGRHGGGTLELEVSDFVHRGRYRVMAVDHDVVSFSDFTQTDHPHDAPGGIHGGAATDSDWPAIVVTNPKAAAYLTPHECHTRIAASAHVRMLVFGPDRIATVSVAIDGSSLGDAAKAAGRPSQLADDEVSPLWVAPWSPAELGAGTHEITVVATDVAGRRHTVTQSFSVDGTLAPLPSGFSQWVLTGNMRWIGQVALLLVHGGVVLGVLLGAELFVVLSHKWWDGDATVQRWLQRAASLALQHPERPPSKPSSLYAPPSSLIKAGIEGGRGAARKAVEWVVPRTVRLPPLRGGRTALLLWARSTASLVAFPYVYLRHTRPAVGRFLLFAALYVPLGPWFVGRVYDNRWTIVFAWGLVPLSRSADAATGSSVPLAIPHYDSAINMVVLLLVSFAPLVHFTAVASAARAYPAHFSRAISVPGLVLAALVLLQALGDPVAVNVFYGPIASVLSPVRLWYHVAAAGIVLELLVTDARQRWREWKARHDGHAPRQRVSRSASSGVGVSGDRCGGGDGGDVDVHGD